MNASTWGAAQMRAGRLRPGEMICPIGRLVGPGDLWVVVPPNRPLRICATKVNH